MKGMFFIFSVVLLCSCSEAVDAENSPATVIEKDSEIEIGSNSEMSQFEVFVASFDVKEWIEDDLEELYLPTQLQGQDWVPNSFLQSSYAEPESENGLAFFLKQSNAVTKVIAINYKEGVPASEIDTVIHNGSNILSVSFDFSDNESIAMTMIEAEISKQMIFDSNSEGKLYVHPEYLYNEEFNAPSIEDLGNYMQGYYNIIGGDEGKEEMAAVSYKVIVSEESKYVAENYWVKMERETCGATCYSKNFSYRIEQLGDTKMVSCNIEKKNKFPGWPELLSFDYLKSSTESNPDATYLFREVESHHFGNSRTTCYLYMKSRMDLVPRSQNWIMTYCTMKSIEDGCDYCTTQENMMDYIKFSYIEEGGTPVVEYFYTPLSYDDDCKKQEHGQQRGAVVYKEGVGFVLP
jgi:hypothetical protein